MSRFTLFFLTLLIPFSFLNASKVIWKIGNADNSATEFALGPSDYKRFLEKDFGYEDRYYLIGKSNPKTDFPYVLPGPEDTWGGTWGTSGWRTHDINVLFNISRKPSKGMWKLVIDLVDSHPNRSEVKVTVNSVEKKFSIKGSSIDVIDGNVAGAQEKILEFEFPSNVIKNGGNAITISILEGSWIVFDQVYLEAPDNTVLQEDNGPVFLRDITTAPYEIELDGNRYQPLLIDAEHLSGNPELMAELDGVSIFKANLDTARYIFEAPMPAVGKSKKSKYRILADNKVLQEGTVMRSPQPLQTFADYVDTKIGSGHSRWMIAPGPWMPMSMVKISPDNQNMGWQSGYQPTFETLGCFSHIHEWTMAGLGMMPTNGELKIKVADQFNPDEGYRSRIDKRTEEAPLGYYKVYMTDTDIQAEVTATTRASFQRYTFPTHTDGRIMIDLHIPSEYDYKLLDVSMKKTSDYRIEGYCHQLSPRPHVWSNDADQEYIVHFAIEFDKPIKNLGGWIDDQVINNTDIKAKDSKEAGMFVEFDTKVNPVVQVRTGISLVSVKNAWLNLEKEISRPFNWDFEAVVQNQKDVWNDIFNRVAITSNDRQEKIRF